MRKKYVTNIPILGLGGKEKIYWNLYDNQNKAFCIIKIPKKFKLDSCSQSLATKDNVVIDISKIKRKKLKRVI
jgi:hypothetical protein